MDKTVKIPHHIIDEMRAIGRSVKDQGFLEIDQVNGNFRWSNEFFLSKTGYSLDQIQRMSIFDVVPSAFHQELTDRMQGSSSPKFSVVPVKTADRKIVWWFMIPVRKETALDWSKGDFIQITEEEGQAFTFMRLMMTATNSSGELHGRMDTMGDWMKTEIARLDKHDKEQDERIKKIEEMMTHAVQAAKSAAQTALDVNSTVKTLSNEFRAGIDLVKSDQATHAGEILKLILNDQDFKQKQDEMIQRIEKTADNATAAITTRATREGQGMARRVTVPVSLIAAVMTLIQWVLTHYR